MTDDTGLSAGRSCPEHAVCWLGQADMRPQEKVDKIAQCGGNSQQSPARAAAVELLEGRKAMGADGV